MPVAVSAPVATREPEHSPVDALLGKSNTPSRNPLLPIKRQIRDIGELTLIYEQDLLDADLLPRHVRSLERRMTDYGLHFLHPRWSRVRTMARYYGGRSQIPLRMLFFNSPLARKLEPAGIVTLRELMIYLPLLLGPTTGRDRSMSELRMTMDDFDMIEIRLVLDEIFTPRLLRS